MVHNIIHQFFRRARADNSGVGGGIWPKFVLIQAFMHVLVTCKNEDDRFKNEGARVFTRFLPLYVYGDFFRRSMAANSTVLLAEFRTRPRCNECSRYLQV